VVKIPLGELSSEALEGVIEEFVMREGTDYGHRDYTLDEKRKRVLRALESGAAVITFEPDSGSTSIVMSDDLD
jgi:uncharacterized protein YheU (UPF0270 family)